MTRTVVYIDLPGNRALPDATTLRVAADGAHMVAIGDPSAAMAAITNAKDVALVVMNAPQLDLFEAIRRVQPKAHTILVTESTMDRYSQLLEGREDVLVDHVVANRLPVEWTIHDLRVTMQKILRGDIFGIGKYLTAGTPLTELIVKGSVDRDDYNNRVMAFAEENRLGHYMAKLAFGITEELLMNAIYDAPLAAGLHHYGELPRTASVELKPEEYSRLTYGCDGKSFAIGVADPFGALRRDKLFQYLKKVLRRGDSTNLIDTKKGGAGLGLFKILYSSHALVCNVQAGKCTEVIALIDIEHQVRDFSRMARSIHYFEIA